MGKSKSFLLFVVIGFVVVVLYFFYPVKPGRVIILDGVSSSGKTSVSNCLLRRLGCSYKKIALDDYVADLFLAKKELNLPQKSFIALISERRNQMYQDIRRWTSCGKHVLLDTVLSGLEGKKDVSIAFEKLQGLEIVKILVYCPLSLITERIEKRNAKSFFEDKPKEMRSIAATLQFCNVYKVLHSEDEFCLGTLSKKDIDMAYEFPDFVPKQDIQIFHSVKKRLLSCFGLHERASVKITPRLRYEYIIDTSKSSVKECADNVCIKFFLK